MIKKLLEKVKVFRNQQMKVPNDYPFVMFEEEKALLKKELQKAEHYLEFGTGGSTLFSLINSSVKIDSVDTNEPWISFIKKYKIVHNNLGNRLKIHFVDIGPTKYWGYPVNDDAKEKFPNFSSKIFEITDPSQYDLILVDGRFRVACALQSIINCYQNKNLRILIHDYSLRNEYTAVEKFLDVVESQKTLFVFKVKEGVNIDEVKEEYEKYKFITE